MALGSPQTLQLVSEGRDLVDWFLISEGPTLKDESKMNLCLLGSRPFSQRKESGFSVNFFVRALLLAVKIANRFQAKYYWYRQPRGLWEEQPKVAFGLSEEKELQSINV